MSWFLYGKCRQSNLLHFSLTKSYISQSSTSKFLSFLLRSFLLTGKLPTHWEGSFSPGSFLLTGRLPSHREGFLSLRSFLLIGKLPSHWKASFSLQSFLVTGKLPSRWEASFSSETSILLGRSLLTGKFPYRWEVESLFTGMLLPPGKLFTTTKLLTLIIFNRRLHSLYHLLGKDTLFTTTSSCL